MKEIFLKQTKLKTKDLFFPKSGNRDSLKWEGGGGGE
jgi:hypothetical protein